MVFTSALRIRAGDTRLIKKSPTKEERACYMESIRPPDRKPLCSKMERCKENEIGAERFKASSRRINQNRVDAVVSAQTGSGTYQGEHPGSTMETALCAEEKRPDKDNYSRDKCCKWRWAAGLGGGAQRGC